MQPLLINLHLLFISPELYLCVECFSPALLTVMFVFSFIYY